MASPPLASTSPAIADGDSAEVAARKEEAAPVLVDPFLVEALENPRHRLTILRMELDIQRFMQSHEQHLFEFQHFPTSYLRRAAHRVAHHYGLQTMALDNLLDGVGRIAVRKTPDSRFPAVCLSDISVKQPENEKLEPVKIIIRTRPNRNSSNGAVESGIRQSTSRTVEEREEEYDKARARIFSDFLSTEVGISSVEAEGGNISLSRQDAEANKKATESENICPRDGSSRVAIFRDREKDLSDPDYDRSYDRYNRGFPWNHNFSLGSYSAFQPFCLQQYEPNSQLGQVARAQTSVGNSPNSGVNPYYAAACNQTSRDSSYVQWPSPAMMYAHSYEHFRNGFLQAPFYQHPLSVEHYQDH